MKTLIVKLTVSDKDVDSLKSNLGEFLGDAPISISKFSWEIVDFVDEEFNRRVINAFVSVLGGSPRNVEGLGDKIKEVQNMLMDEYGSDDNDLDDDEIRAMVIKYIISKIK